MLLCRQIVTMEWIEHTYLKPLCVHGCFRIEFSMDLDDQKQTDGTRSSRAKNEIRCNLCHCRSRWNMFQTLESLSGVQHLIETTPCTCDSMTWTSGGRYGSVLGRLGLSWVVLGRLGARRRPGSFRGQKSQVTRSSQPQWSGPPQRGVTL